MYRPDEITTKERLAGWLRCQVKDLPVLIKKEDALTVFNIPKRNRNGYRTVYKVRNYLISDALKCLKSGLSKLYNADECVGGFVTGRNIAYNAKFHLNKNFVLNLDITNFFESIPHKTVVCAFEKLGFINKIAIVLADIVTYNEVLVAGFNTSPIIANIVCKEMDDDIISLCMRNNISYSRYADDLSFSGDTIEIIEEITEIIQRYGFSINEAKTRIYKRGQSQYVTGLTVADKTIPRVPRKIKKSLRAAIHYSKTYGLLSHVEHIHGANLQNSYMSDTFCKQEAARIMGWIHYINGIEPVFAHKCIAELKQVMDREDREYFENADMYVNYRKE